MMQTRVFDKTQLLIAAEAIQRGDLIAFPTETVYGLGANAFDEKAVAKVFRVKGRPSDNPLIVHVANAEQAESLFQNTPKGFHALVERFFPGPLSIIGWKNDVVPSAVTAGLPRVAVRMPHHRLALAFIRLCGVPLVAPSANRSGKVSPTSASEVIEELGGRIAGVIEGGRCSIGIESTVLDLTSRQPTILRPGCVTAGEIEGVLGVSVRIGRGETDRPASPGMKYTHYAPAAQVVLFFGPQERVQRQMIELADEHQQRGKRVGLLAPRAMKLRIADAFHSLQAGSAIDYAREMYRGLRALDHEAVDVIFCPAIAEEGLGIAVMNRLKKAASAIVDVRKR